ncbi:hypothetical protein ISF_01738 [Cordyceps fumosorosea ARSEF 2679]|uniref:Uncharacterized protein n=1 Tax=Cordyceps fumosorosea (strain ARSEF 2679) TaxID=1081104 RepID=A0A168CBG2_CORFA|nr:hypothetical protein ISF_01738 [Cordyceps fumosorosea ARSEF 2679]OAA71187.1 hypothetical protein ISF_01738 [Cordyceps fumosorosea ARSEF 2679]
MAAHIILGLLSLTTAAAPAGATTEQQPEVIPGPGMPSLQELGVTSAELYQQGLPKPAELSVLSANFNPICGPNESRYTNVNGLVACFHYLQKLGTQQCKVPSEHSVFCRAGDAVVLGQAANLHGASSYCRDVATGLLYTIDHCTRPDKSCAGAQAAGGNGNLIVVSGDKRVYG